MSFIISKLVWALLAPGTLLFLIAVASLALQRRSPAASRLLLAAVVLVIGSLVLSPVGAWLLRPLESRFGIPSLQTTPVTGIIVLGGALDAAASMRTGTPVLNDSAERLTAFATLARRFPSARLVFTGGSGDLRAPEAREADEVRGLLDALGIDLSRIVFERDSRNTFENAEQSRDLLRPKPDETWLLITSAWHMPRAVGCFRHAGWNVIAYPVDFRSYSDDRWLSFQADQQLDMASTALREWLGLFSYWLMGRIDNLFPSEAGST